jgi:hypothetical protein
LLERVAFLLAVEGPVAAIRPPSVLIFEMITEEILEPVLSSERITFEVEEDIAVARLWKIGKPEAWLDREQLELQFTGVARLDLDTSLLSDLGEAR